MFWKRSFHLTAVLFSTIAFHSALSFSHRSVFISKIKPKPYDHSTETSLFLSSVTVDNAREEPLITQQENTEDITFMGPTEAVLVDDTEKSFVREFTPMQNVLRIIPFLTAGFYLVNPQPLDDLTSSLWSAIYNWDFAQNPLFEAEVATFGFLQAIIFYMNIHRVLGEEKTRETRFDGGLPEDRNDFYIEGLIPIVTYLGSIWLYLQFHEKPPMPVEAPTFGVFAVETIFGVWLYDLCFFPLHYIMHKINSNQVRRFHAYHHRWSKEGSLTALETVQHSYVDGFLQVATNIAVQHVSPFGGPKHVLSRLFHNLIVTYMLSEAHSGYDLPWMTHNIYPEILGGSPRHERHHHNGRVYYQQYFKYIDDFFGFVEDDRSSKSKKPTLAIGSEPM